MLLVLFIIITAGCGKSAANITSAAASLKLDAVQRQLAALPCPPGVSAELWDVLTAELLAQVEKRMSAGPLVTGPPLDELSIVDDLTATEPTLGNIRLRWTYKNTGDYDQNTETNISDLTPVGLHFNKTPASGDWNRASVADGDLNHEVNIADVTPIGRCFLQAVTEYWIEFNASGAPGTLFEHRATVLITDGQSDANDWLAFEETLSLAQSGYYRVVPYYFEQRGIEGSPVYFGANQPPDAVLTADPQAGRTPLVVNFDASASHDPENLALTFEWDWEGDGVYDHQSATPLQQHEYTEEGEYAPILKATDNKGAEATDQLAVYCHTWEIHEVVPHGGSPDSELISGIPAIMYGVADKEVLPDKPSTLWFARATQAVPASNGDWEFSEVALPFEDGEGGWASYSGILLFELQGNPCALLSVGAPIRDYFFAQATSPEPNATEDWSISKIADWAGNSDSGTADVVAINDQAYIFVCPPDTSDVWLFRSLISEPQGPEDWEITTVADYGIHEGYVSLTSAAYFAGQLRVAFTDLNTLHAAYATSATLTPHGPQDWQVTVLEPQHNSIARNIVEIDGYPIVGLTTLLEPPTRGISLARGTSSTPGVLSDWVVFKAANESSELSGPTLVATGGGCIGLATGPRGTSGKQVLALYPRRSVLLAQDEPWTIEPINPEQTGTPNYVQGLGTADWAFCLYSERNPWPVEDEPVYFCSANMTRRWSE